MEQLNFILLKKRICKDFLVSGQLFELHYHADLDMLSTHPVPAEEDLSNYYQSDAYISHTDSKRSFFDFLYQFVKGFSLRKKVRLLNKLNVPSKTLLDVGCGTGSFLQVAQSRDWLVTGIEPNSEARRLAQDKCKGHTPFYESLDSLLSDTSSPRFDVITLWHVLEHVPDYNQYIQKLKKVLSPRGVLLIAVPNFKSYDASYFQEYWAAYDVPRHLWHFSSTAIKRIFLQHHMKLLGILPLKFDSYYVSILSQKNKYGKSNYLSAFWIGLRSNLKARGSHEYSSLIYLFQKQE